MCEHAAGWVVAAVPPTDPGAAFAERLRDDARALRGRLALPLFVAAASTYQGAGRARLDVLARMAARAGGSLLATNDVRFHEPGRRRLADVLTAIRLRTTVMQSGNQRWKLETEVSHAAAA